MTSAIHKLLSRKDSLLRFTRRRSSFFNSLKNLFNSPKIKENNVQVLTEADLRLEQQREKKKNANDVTQLFDKIVDDAIPKEKRGMAGFVVSNIIKFVGKRVIAQAGKSSETRQKIIEECLSILQQNKAIRTEIGDNLDIGAIFELNESIINFESRLQMAFFVVGSNGQGTVRLRAQNEV
jgi:uncharacterized protein YggL (DUF469 family)